MASNIDLVILNKSNYVVSTPDMETLLNTKWLWKFTKTVIPDPTDDHENFVVYGKKDEAMRVIMTYISWEIHFHLSGIDFPHEVLKNMNALFNRVDERHIMQLDK